MLIPGQMAEVAGMGLPVLSVEFRKVQVDRCIKAAGIDGPSIRIRARPVKGLHTTGPAEQMFGHAGIEDIFGEIFMTVHQPEAALCNDHVNKTDLAAHRTVTGLRLNRFDETDLEADRSTVASARMPMGVHHR